MRNVIIGDCSLFHADSLEMMRTWAGDDVDLIVSDVPYKLTSGGQTEGGLHERFGGGGVYDNSGNFFEDCPDWSEFMPLLYKVLRDPGHCYTMSDGRNVRSMLNTAEDSGFRFHNLLYWDKRTVTPNRWYMKNAEFVGFFFKGKAFAINNCSSKQGVEMAHRDESEHPTEKPVMLMKNYIENSSQPGQTVLDPFMGTGTTGVAAVMSGRKFIGIEISERWFDVACDRISRAHEEIKRDGFTRTLI